MSTLVSQQLIVKNAQAKRKLWEIRKAQLQKEIENVDNHIEFLDDIISQEESKMDDKVEKV